MIVKYLPSYIPGGLGTHVYNLSKSLVDLGNDVDIFCWKISGQPEVEHSDGINIYHVPFPFRTGIHYLDSYTTQIALILYLRKYLKSTSVDIIHGHGLLANAYPLGKKLGILPKIPFVYTLHGVSRLHLAGSSFLKRRIMTVFHSIESNCVKDSDILIAVSKKTAKDALKHYRKKINRERIRVVYGGVNVSSFQNRSIKVEKIRKDDNMCLYVGFLSRQKGLDFLLQSIPIVISRIPNAKFIIVGRGHISRYQKKVEELGITDSAIFTGIVSDKELYSYYKTCDLFVLPSLYEGFGQVFLEAMAAGKPIVATKTGPIPEIIIEGQTGLLVKPKAIRELANAIITLLMNKDLARKMGKLGQKRAEKIFTWETAANKTLKVYSSILDKES